MRITSGAPCWAKSVRSVSATSSPVYALTILAVVRWGTLASELAGL
jgi:hypothetical protein